MPLFLYPVITKKSVAFLKHFEASKNLLDVVSAEKYFGPVVLLMQEILGFWLVDWILFYRFLASTKKGSNWILRRFVC